MWGQIAGAVIGGVMGQKSAKADRKAQAEANRLNNMGYTDAQPYIKGAYSGGQKALNDALAQGYYGGPTFAGFNDQMNTGLNNRFNLGTAGFNNANNFMNNGAQFANNADALYRMASNDNLADAQQYATNNSQSLIDAAMRGADRNLNEVQLPGLNRMAAGSGNTNNSRSGLAEAVMRRANAETYADTATNVNRGLMSDYMDNRNNMFRNMTGANTNLGNLFTQGFNLGNSATGMQTGVGGAFQGNTQAGFDDARQRFEGERDFAGDQYNKFMSGVMGRAPMNPAGYQTNYHNPTMGALSGAQAGFGFGGKYLSPIFEGKAFGGPSAGPSAMQPYTGLNLL